MRNDEDMFLDKFAGQVLANLIVHHRYQESEYNICYFHF
jgi:hypothetical protein